MEKNKILENNVEMFQNLIKSDGTLEAPICIAENFAKPLLLNQLTWKNWEISSKLKVTNTGHTAMLTGKWDKGRPSICGGPFTEPYKLAQIHFHWGGENSEGSEHMLNGQRFPLEMHVLLYRTSLKKPKLASNDPRGLALLVYFFEVSEAKNECLELISHHTKNLKPFHSAFIECEVLVVVKPFTNNYYLYWGSLLSKHCSHILSWLVYPNRLNISVEQLNNFRMMVDDKGSYIIKNYGCVKPLHNRNVFHVLSEFSEGKGDGPSGDGKSFSLEIEKFEIQVTESNQFCCLAIRRKPKNCTIQEIMKSLNYLEVQTCEKLQMIEELSLAIIMKDAKERKDWLKAIENQIRRTKLKAVLESNKGNITAETFNQLKLRNIFFKNIKRQKNCFKDTADDISTRFIRNALFRETPRSQEESNLDQNKIKWVTEDQIKSLLTTNNCNFSPSRTIRTLTTTYNAEQLVGVYEYWTDKKKRIQKNKI